MTIFSPAMAKRSPSQPLDTEPPIEVTMKRVWFLCLALALVGASQAQTNPHTLVVRGGTLVDVASGLETPDRAIIIEGQRIECVGTVASTNVPEGAQVVDGRGKWIVPGLIDSHGHAGDDENMPMSLVRSQILILRRMILITNI
jgi:hypothetical protein